MSTVEDARMTAAPKLFTRQASGLVREVSTLNALAYNVSVIGNQGSWLPVYYALPFVPVGITLFSTYGWAALIAGAFSFLYALIFISFGSVMPRSGGNYVVTTRVIPRYGPLLGWLESWTFIIGFLMFIPFEVVVTMTNVQIAGRIIGLGTGVEFFKNASNWFTSGGTFGGWPAFLGSLVILALIALVALQPTRRFHRIVTSIVVVTILSVPLMFIAGLLFTSQSDFAANLPKVTGQSVAQLTQVAAQHGLLHNGVDWTLGVMALMIGVVFSNYLGFQLSAYSSGEIRGNPKRGAVIPILGSLFVFVFLSTVYIDVMSFHFGLNTQLGWGALYWLGDPHVPLGVPNLMPVMATVASPTLWPVWLIQSIMAAAFPFLFCPVLVHVTSRMSLAWSLDRQVPAWFGQVNERLRQPLNAILVTLGFVIVLFIFQNFTLLPQNIGANGRLNLASTVWFSVLMSFLFLLMPGVNAIVSGRTRPDIVEHAPFRRWMPVFGIVWIAFILFTYWFVAAKPLYDAIRQTIQPNSQQSFFNYLSQTGILFVIVFAVLGIVIYIVQQSLNRARNINLRMLYQELPPE